MEKGRKNYVLTTHFNRRQYTVIGAVKSERTILSGGNPWDGNTTSVVPRPSATEALKPTCKRVFLQATEYGLLEMYMGT
jgi:hypothetical protein